MHAGKKLDQAWAVEYTDIVRKNAIDQDPYYVAPEVLPSPHALLEHSSV